MHAHIILDDQLVAQAFELTGLKNTQELIDMALREFVIEKKSNPLAEAFGKYPWDGDLETMRCDNVAN